jgi:hypothetical protein
MMKKMNGTTANAFRAREEANQQGRSVIHVITVARSDVYLVHKVGINSSLSIGEAGLLALPLDRDVKIFSEE